jgi:hypothetical protein
MEVDAPTTGEEEKKKKKKRKTEEVRFPLSRWTVVVVFED